MVQLQLNTEGRLRQLQAMPPLVDAGRESSTATRWEDLFAVAGLDAERFLPSEPKWRPSSYADERVAWDGAYRDAPEISIRIEAASVRGRVVSFRIVEPWGEPSEAADDAWFRPSDVVPSSSARIAHVTFHFVFMVALTLLARGTCVWGAATASSRFVWRHFSLAWSCWAGSATSLPVRIFLITRRSSSHCAASKRPSPRFLRCTSISSRTSCFSSSAFSCCA